MTLDQVRTSKIGYVDHATMALVSQRMGDLGREYPDLLSHFSVQDFRGNWPPEFQRYDKGLLESWLAWLQCQLEERFATPRGGCLVNAEAILLIHGIRDFAEWQSNVSDAFADVPNTRTIPLKYGRFDAFRFWFPFWTRRGPIDKLLWRIRDARKRFPAGISVIAHSFGTYAIGTILNENPDIRLHRLILCGGILPSDFRWDKLSERVETEIINECGINDIWPVMAESTTFGYGSSGRFGFGAPGVLDRYHNFGHCGFLDEEFVRSFWLPWFKEDRIVSAGATPPASRRWHLLTIIQIKWVAIFFLLFFVLGVVLHLIGRL
jgi:hypothetical protein